MTYAEFIKIFPEFSAYPEARVELFISEAEGQISEQRFGKSTKFAQALFVAHYLTSLDNGQRQKSETVTETGADGSVTTKTQTVITGGELSKGAAGSIASKTVGSVSVSYDTASTSFAEAGYWNSTPYGKQFFSLLKRFRRMPFAVNGRTSWP